MSSTERARVSFDNFYSSEAHGDLWREYREEIASLVREAIADNTSEDDDQHSADEDGTLDTLTEWIDSHNWVIYTGKAALVPLISNSDPEDELDDLGIINATTEQRAYACMMQDAREELRRQLDEIEAANADDATEARS